MKQWRQVKAEIKKYVLENGHSERVGAFVQCYGNNNLDASVLMLPLVGFIPATNPRIKATIRAVQKDLSSLQGYVYRYRSTTV